MTVYDQDDQKPTETGATASGGLDASKLPSPRMGDLSAKEKAEALAEIADSISETLRPVSEALEAHEQGDKRPLMDLASEHLGLALDGKFKSFLDAAVGHTLEKHDIGYEELPIPGLYKAIRLLGIRLDRDAEIEHAEEQNPMVRGRMRLKDRHHRALDHLTVEGQRHEEALRERLPGAAYREDYQPAGVAEDVYEEGTERTRKFTVLPTADVPETPDADPELEAVTDLDALREILDQAGLSTQERESFVFGELLGSKAAAKLLGRPATQIANEKSRARKKLQAVA